MEYNWVVCCVLIAIVVGGAFICFYHQRRAEPFVTSSQPNLILKPSRMFDNVPIEVDERYNQVPYEECYHGYDHDYVDDEYKYAHEYGVVDYNNPHTIPMSKQVGLGFGVGPGLYGSGRHTSEMKGN